MADAKKSDHDKNDPKNDKNPNEIISPPQPDSPSVKKTEASSAEGARGVGLHR